MSALVRAAGYDDEIVQRLSHEHATFFPIASAAAVAGVVVVAAGVGFGARLAIGAWPPAILVGLAAAGLVLALVRIMHGGTGFPVHHPIEDLQTWKPAWVGVVVLLALGAMLAQPVVLLSTAPFVEGGGIIARAHAAWEHPYVAGVTTLLVALLVASPAWLRRAFVVSVRAYERERWIDDRILVDDAFADAQDQIGRLLEGVPGFVPPLAVHYADPPYNTQPLRFGYEPQQVERGAVQLVVDAPPPAPVELAPSRPPPPLAPPEDEAAPPQWDDPSHDDDEGPPRIEYLDVGRLSGQRARRHADLVAPFVATFTGRDLEEVRALLRAAPDDMRVHRLFSEWKKLPAILLKTAGFALDHDMASVLSIVVEKPVDEVLRRLRAVPRERKLTGVFAPELARRILPKRA